MKMKILIGVARGKDALEDQSALVGLDTLGFGAVRSESRPYLDKMKEIRVQSEDLLSKSTPRR